MGSREDDVEVDDDFSELYKEYTGPPRCSTTSVPKTSKRSHAASDEEEETLDPNAVPTDFTSREAKVWEAKSKATERNWKKRKEEEMICKICGDSTHFTQGCPSTLGANRRSQEVFERVPARDPQVRALFSERVIRKIEKDIGCKIKMEEKFIIVSGKDGQILSKGVDAIHRIKNEGESNSNTSPKPTSPVSSRMGRSDSQRSNPSPRNPSHYNQRPARHEKMIEEHVREEFHKYPRGSPQARADGARSRSTHSKSPAQPPPYTTGGGGSYFLHDSHRGRDAADTHKGGYSSFPQTLEELELEYKRDAMDIATIRDKEQDQENYRHREAVREMRESYTKRLGMVREMQSKQWEEFLQVDMVRRRQQPSGLGGGYKKQESYYEYGGAPYNNNNNNPMESSRGRYAEVEKNAYGAELQRQRHKEQYDGY